MGQGSSLGAATTHAQRESLSDASFALRGVWVAGLLTNPLIQSCSPTEK